jgi:2-methylisocitrate lyase-like PEP mutase family enzyme
MRSTQTSLVRTFRALHESGCFVLPNPWDIGTAIYLERLGFKALATTSAGFAFSRSKPDGGVPRDDMLAHIREIVNATALPVNADFHAGYADDPENVAANVRLCCRDLALLDYPSKTARGAAIIRYMRRSSRSNEFERRAPRIDDSKTGVVLTGRCEAWLVGDSDPLRTALERLGSVRSSRRRLSSTRQESVT